MAGVMSPKLLVVLQHGGRREDDEHECDERLQRALSHIIEQQDRVPALFLRANDTAGVVEEVTAAVEAMHWQPHHI